MSRNTRYALAGLQAGISGAITLLLWMSLASRFFGKSVWWTANLLSSAFYGESALGYAFGRHTISGAALVLFMYGALGIVFGLLWRNRSGGAVMVAAALFTAVLAYYVLVKWALRTVSPLGAIYAPERQIFLGHLLFGMVLARYPRFRDRLLPQIPLGSE